MREYLNIANSRIFYYCGAAIISLVILQAILFTRLAFKEGLKLGIAKGKMLKAFRTGAISSIVPTLAIIVALITMVPTMGIPIPWIRLSIIGSAPYELMAAGIGAKTMGVSSLGGEGFTAQVFASSVWIMCIGSVWSVTIVAVFLKKIKTAYSSITNTDPIWRETLMNAAFLGVFCIFIADPIVKGGLPLATTICGAGIMTVFASLIVKLKQSWLREFALAFSMIGAMLCTIFISRLF